MRGTRWRIVLRPGEAYAPGSVDGRKKGVEIRTCKSLLTAYCEGSGERRLRVNRSCMRRNVLLADVPDQDVPSILPSCSRHQCVSASCCRVEFIVPSEFAGGRLHQLHHTMYPLSADTSLIPRRHLCRQDVVGEVLSCSFPREQEKVVLVKRQRT